MSQTEICRTKRPICIENSIQPGIRRLCWEIQLVEPVTLCTKYFEEKSRPQTLSGASEKPLLLTEGLNGRPEKREHVAEEEFGNSQKRGFPLAS